MIAAIYESVIRPELYDAFMDAWGMHIQKALKEQDLPEGGIDAGRMDAEELEVDPGLQAHFARAYEILEQIGRKSPHVTLPEQVRAMPGFALLAFSDGQIKTTSAAARSLMDLDGGLDRLRDHLSGNSWDLLGELVEAARTGARDTAPVILTGDETLPRHLMARLAPIEAESESSAIGIVIESLDYKWNARAETMLVNSFGLSRAETDIVRNLLAGLSLREIAQESGRSEHTVRNQAKAVLAKTGAPGQVDLIRLVVFLINQDNSARPPSAAESSLPSDIRKMGSGLNMQVFRLGPDSGQPVIFLHGMLDSVTPLRFLHRGLTAAGYRVIAPMRPGFVRSDRVQRADRAMDVFCDHVEELIETERLKRPILLTHMGGSMYGRALAGRLYGRVAGLVSVAGNVPILRLGQLSAMAPRQRVVAYTARFAPALLPTILRAGIAQVDSKDIVGFVNALFKPGTHENRTMESLGIADLFQAGVRLSVQQGHIGFATDSHYVVRDWSKHVPSPTAPTISIHGGLDPVVPAASLIEASSTWPQSEVRVFEDAGQLVLYEKPDEVLRALADMRALAAAAVA